MIFSVFQKVRFALSRGSKIWLLPLFLLFPLTLGLGCAGQVTKTMGHMVLGQQVDYLNIEGATGSHLTQLSEKVWTYNWGFDRTLIVDTSEGLVVIDSFSDALSEHLLEKLRAQGLDKPVHTLIYTHFHLDHVGGGQRLKPQHVIAHKKTESYWADFDIEDLGIAKPTQTIDGDFSLVIGGVRFDLLYGGFSHTDTFYAVHLPEERLLYAADTVGVEVFLPVGGVALYTPGYFRMLDRIASIDFDTFVSSHFKVGDKKDFLAARNLQKTIQKTLHEAASKYKGDVALHQNKKALLEMFDEVHDKLYEEYGDWHGFSAQIVPTIMGAYVNDLVGN